MIITWDDIDGFDDLKLQLAKMFEMDLGPLHYFLRIEVAYSPKGYLFCQSKYIANILEQARLSHTKLAYTTLGLNVKYS